MGQFQVPGYELGQLLTAGATGEFWHAHAGVSGENVALRRLRLPSADKADQLRRLVTLVSMVDHPHLLTIRESVPIGEEFALVMDYPDGGNLDQLLSGRGTLDPGEIVTTIGPVAEALAAAHERDLVHGDIQPEAIWYLSDGRPLLADIGLFGLLNESDTPRMHSYGDPASSEPNAAGDVYALAAVCHTAVTGIVPNPGQQRPSLQEAPTKVPNGLVHAVEAGLAEEGRRPSAADFTELIYSAYPAAPVRFPVGLALSDADIAAALAQAGVSEPGTAGTETSEQGAADQDEAGASGQPAAPDGQNGQSDQSQPSQPGEAGQPGAQPSQSGIGAGARPGHPGAQQPGQPQATQAAVGPATGPSAQGRADGPVDPFALAASGVQQPNMFGPTPDVVDDDEDDGPRPRIGLWIGVAVLALVVVVGGGIGLWYLQQGNDDNPTAEGRNGEQGAGSDGGEQQNGDGNQTGDTGEGDGQQGTGDGPPADETPEESAWRERLQDLDKIRAAAFAEPDPGKFDQVYAPSADDLAQADRDQLESPDCGGCRLEGVRFRIKQLDVVNANGQRAVLRVTDQRQPYTVVMSSGEEVPQGAGPDQRREFTLTKVNGNWRIASIDEL